MMTQEALTVLLDTLQTAVDRLMKSHETAVSVQTASRQGSKF